MEVFLTGDRFDVVWADCRRSHCEAKGEGWEQAVAAEEGHEGLRLTQEVVG